MKRTFAAVGCLLLVAGLCRAQNVKETVLTATIGTNAAVAVTSDTSVVSGWIWEIKLDAVTAAATANVSVVAVPGGLATTTFGNITLATDSTNDSEVIVRPRFDGTTTDGTANTGDPPEPYMCAGDTIRYVALGGATGTVHRALIKWISTVNR
jgi:hypothetical protein